MKRTSPKWKPAKGNSSPSPIRDRTIVFVDDSPLRKRAASDFKRAMENLEKGRIELRRFETEDVPAFGRWMASNFGALQTVTRENARLISEQTALVEDVELEMILGNHRNPRNAYEVVMRRRECQDSAGSTARNEGQPGNDSDSFEEQDISPDPRQEIFEDYLQFIGIDPDLLGPEEYLNLFVQFQLDEFDDVIGAGSTPEGNPFDKLDGVFPSSRGHEVRIKEIYRILVRRLHPDLRADRDFVVSAIWHEVQEAYEARNVDRLETLLALTEMEHGEHGGQSSLSQMHNALGELKRSLGAIQRSIREAKQDPAWRFQFKGDHAILEIQVRREIDLHLAEQRQVLAGLNRILDDWARHPKPSGKDSPTSPCAPFRPTSYKRNGRAQKATAKPGTPHQAVGHGPVQGEFFSF